MARRISHRFQQGSFPVVVPISNRTDLTSALLCKLKRLLKIGGIWRLLQVGLIRYHAFLSSRIT